LRVTRRHLRKIIIENLNLAESPLDQSELEQLVHNREDQPYSSRTISTSHREYAKQTGTHEASPEEIDAQFDMRRDVKKFWNENADHKFWQDPNQVIAIHDLSYYTELDDYESFTSEELQGELDLSFEAFLRKYPPGEVQRDEMSSYGFLGMQQFMARSLIAHRIDLGVVLNPRRVTYASAIDSFTESRGKASHEDKVRHKASGLPKRPAVGKYFQGKDVLFDREDVLRMSTSDKRTSIGELIIKHWSYDTVVINMQNNQAFSLERVNEIVSIAKASGLKVFDGSQGIYI